MKLIFSIVPHLKGEKLTRAAMESGCRGGTVLMGRSLARSNLSAVLGLGESARDIIMMVVARESKNSVKNAIIQTALREKKGFGELFSVEVNSIIRAGVLRKTEPQPDNTNQEAKETDMENNVAGEMITVIVNKGYADDVMFAARKAGAGGGTVLNARGTARETDQRFFGMHIVPEKEMLVMVVPADKKDAVMTAIHELKCLKEPGMGIAYSTPVEDFELLGRKK